MLRRIFRLLSVPGIVVILSGFPESGAEAGFLKNGVRPRDGDRLQTIKPPRAGVRKRLRVPGERRSAPTRGSTERRGSAKQQHGWFWKTHSIGLAAASTQRWGQVSDLMAERRSQGKGIVSTKTLSAILQSHRAQIATAARRHGISDALVLAVIAVESRGKPGAVSPKGAQGLMQLIPATAKRFGVTNSFNTGQNILGGTAYLDWLLKEFRGDPLLALAGYNAGEGAVRKHNGVPPFRETRDYIVKVMDAVAGARALCVTPPATPRSPCAWKTGIAQGS